MKQKGLLCCSVIIDKLGQRCKTFKDLERIVKFQGKSLTEAAPEVREEARKGLSKLKSYLN
jgi:hypothetical protein